MAETYQERSGNGGVSRREFLGSATLTAAGVATGLSFYFSRPQRRDYSELEMPVNQVRLGYIGVGNRGGSLLRSSLQAPGCRPVAVADVRSTQRDEFVAKIREESPVAKKESESTKKAYQVHAYADYRRLLDRKDVEGVIIATPHYLHGPMAIDALEAGKHVYCEKAMAYTVGENQDLYNMVAKLRGRVFQVGHQRRYSPLYQKVKEMVDGGALGDIAALRAQWNQKNVERRACPDPALEKVVNWRLYSEFSGGLATEFASHQVDVANWILGTHPDSVCGYGGVDWYRDGRDTFDNIHLIFNYKVPAVERDEYGRVRQDTNGQPVTVKEEGRTLLRDVRFTYTSMMQNDHLGPSEMILGTRGSIEVCLSGGGEYFIQPSAQLELAALEAAQDAKKKGASSPRKAVKAGATIGASCLKRKKGELIEVHKDKGHWS
ncbi:MAG TPA: Gfo/Idh/MocA family oxidoreductase, partial [Planctomycetota bacterium]|nr:Gfo/Idh/MocA family oxidoreductase [Planctomycetota bacterium]